MTNYQKFETWFPLQQIRDLLQRGLRFGFNLSSIGVEIQAVKCYAASAIDLGCHLLRCDESRGWMRRTDFHNIH